MELTWGAFGVGESARRWSSFFPFAAANPETASPSSKATGTRQAGTDNRCRILVVEDHLDTLRSLKLLLTRLGYHVLIAKNMTEALGLAEDEPFDILLSDIGLPDGSGLELIRRLRHIRNVPALAISGFGMEEDVQRSRDAGFADHLTKPVSLDRLQSAISDLEGQAG
ncbi:MAG TPA: response regulator [Chthoniobacterales bacterium]|nr:response regulator [Chthoniobacterales bacterium]